MNRRRLLLPLALLSLIACSDEGGGSSDDSDDRAPSCGLFTGTYVQTDVRDTADPGDCPVLEEPPATIELVDKQDGTATITQESGAVASCTVKTDGCLFTSNCELAFGGTPLATLRYSLTFSTSGYSGSVIVSRPDNGRTCTGNYSVTAVRK